jgi:hypothetical protein
MHTLTEKYSIRISPSPSGSGTTVSFSVFCGVFVAKEVDGVEMRSGDTTLGDAQAPFMNMFLRFACYIDEVYFQ